MQVGRTKILRDIKDQSLVSKADFAGKTATSFWAGNRRVLLWNSLRTVSLTAWWKKAVLYDTKCSLQHGSRTCGRPAKLGLQRKWVWEFLCFTEVAFLLIIPFGWIDCNVGLCISFSGSPPGLARLVRYFEKKQGEGDEEARRRFFRRIFGILWVGFVRDTFLSWFLTEEEIPLAKAARAMFCLRWWCNFFWKLSRRRCAVVAREKLNSLNF